MTTRMIPHARLFTEQGYGTVLPVTGDAQAARLCLAHNAYAFTVMKLECAVQDSTSGPVWVPIPQDITESALRYVGVGRLYTSEDVQNELNRILQEKQPVALDDAQTLRVKSLRDAFNDLDLIHKQHHSRVFYVENPFFPPDPLNIRGYMPLNNKQKVYNEKAKLIWPTAKPRLP